MLDLSYSGGKKISNVFLQKTCSHVDLDFVWIKETWKSTCDCACTCVPGAVTAAPGKFSGKGGEKVKEGPGQDDNVVTQRVKYDHLAAVAHT